MLALAFIIAWRVTSFAVSRICKSRSMSNPTGDNGLMKHWTVDHCPLRSCGSTVRGRLNDHNNARNKYLYQTFSKTQNCNLNWMNIPYLTNFLTSYFISLDCYTKICWLCALLAFNGQVFFRQGRAFFSVITPLDLTSSQEEIPT